MSARHRQAKKQMSEWAVLLPSLGESLRIASLLTAGQEHVVTTTNERPIQVGDYVRWERGPADPDYWIEGYIEDETDDTVRIRTVMRGPGSPIWMRSWARLRVSGPNSCVVRRVPRPVAPERAPLHIHYDGAPLVELVDRFVTCQRELDGLCKLALTDAQRAAVSAHWSAELRAKVAASNAERRAREVSVLCQGDYDDDEPWGPR